MLLFSDLGDTVHTAAWRPNPFRYLAKYKYAAANLFRSFTLRFHSLLAGYLANRSISSQMAQ